MCLDNILTDGRWDEQTTKKFPAHVKALLTSILDNTNNIEELKLQKKTGMLNWSKN